MAFSYKSVEYKKPRVQVPSKFPSGCLTCGERNTEVKYYGERHVCDKCKKFIQTTDDKPVELVITPDDRVYAFWKEFKAINFLKPVFHPVDFNDLRVLDMPCYATVAGHGELVVLLK